MSDYVQLKNLQGQPLKPVTDLAAINMTTTNGIQVVPANGGTIGITSGYINSAYYVDMVSEGVGPASTSSAYIEGGTATLITGAYTVTSAVNSSTPSQQKIPSEAAVVSALNNVVTSGTSYYAGTGIAIDAGHTVSVSGVPTSAVAGLDTQLTNINAAVAAKQDAISAGYRMSLDGTTLNQQRYFPVKDAGTSATITLEAGSAYKIQATTGSKTLTAETVSAGMFGLEGHAEIFIAGAGLIKTTSNVILAQPLEPDSVNNCTVRFHDGRAIISIEDHIAGHVVRSSGSGTESLKYWLETANTSDQATQYISVDASLDHTGLDFASATVNGEKHLVGNGYEVTSVGGMINCGTSKFTVSNLSLINTAITGGTMTFGDAFIPSGSTVAVSGGRLAVEKVTGSMGVIDLGGTYINMLRGTIGSVDNVMFIGGSGLQGAVVEMQFANSQSKSTLNMTNVTVSGGQSIRAGFVYIAYGGNTANLTSCTVLNCANYAVGVFSSSTVNMSACVFSGTSDYDVNIVSGGSCAAKDCTMLSVNNFLINSGGTLTLAGENKLKGKTDGTSGTVTISGGAILDLTGNSNPTPIAPGGGIVFESGGATVQLGPSAGTVDSSYMMDNVTLLAGAKLTNTAVVNLGGTHIVVSSGSTAYASGCTFSGGDGTSGGAFIASYNTGGLVHLIGCTVTQNNASRGAGIYCLQGSCFIESSVVSGNTGTEDIVIRGASVTVSGGTLGTVSLQTYNGSSLVNLGGTVSLESIGGVSGTVNVSSGAILDLTENPNATPINPGGGITFESGGATVYPSAGSASAVNVNIAGGTLGCSQITNGGVLVMPSAAFPITAGATLSGNATVEIPNQSVIPTATFSGVTFTGSGHIVGNAGETITFSGCNVSVPLRNRSTTKYGNYVFVGDCTVQSVSNDDGVTSGTVTISGGASINLTSSINPGGTGGITVLTGGCTVNGNAIPAGTYTSIDSNGQPT